jgi:transcriptional regulator with XRE-family HTH domain
MRTLGDYIKEYRDKKDLSLRDFAKLCDLSHSYVASLEKGIDSRSKKPVVPTIETLEKIAKATNTTLRQLLVELGYIDDDYDFDKANAFIIEFINGMREKGIDIKDEPLDKILDRILLAAELINKAKESN